MAIRFVSLVLLAFALLAPPAGPQAAQAADSPSGVVERLNATLLEVMKNAKELGFQGRFDRLLPVLTETFNFEVMARISVGRHLRDLNEAQRAQLVESFTRMSVGTFASRFDGYSGERFELVGEEPAPRDTVLVRNKLTKKDGEVVEINYLLKKYGERWQAVDVYLDSKYSELAMKRSEYTSVVSNDGFDGLIRRIDEKLTELAGRG